MLLIDGDILVYSIGFALETRWYELECEETGTLLKFDTKKELLQYDPSLVHVRPSREADDPSAVPMIINAHLKKWRKLSGDYGDLRIFLTDKDSNNNFRKQLNPEYKANRKDTPKPIHYDYIRNVLLNEWEAEEVTGYEADDALGIHQTKDTIIVTKDKDLWQVGGEHFNITTGQRFTCLENPGKLRLKKQSGKKSLVGYGFKWFAAQCLLGDIIDNIKGIDRYGPVKVYNLLNPLNTKQEIWDAVKKVYDKHEREDLLMNAQMLWILREEGDYFDEKKI